MRAQRAPRGTNLEQLGTFNQAVVLHAIRQAEGISRVEIGEVTGLANQTVTNICRRLMANGLIVEGATVARGLGKPRTPLHINAGARHALGIHIDPALTTIVLLDLAGSTVRAERFTTPASERAPEETIRHIGGSVNSFLADSKVFREGVLGIGVATPGPVGVEQGIVDRPPHLPGWRKVPVRSELEQITGLPVHLEKDVAAAATAENWAGTFAGASTAALFYLGTGIGAGLVVNGEVVRGSTSNAGEIGHIVVAPGGELCTCGQRGCVNATIAAQALVRAGNGRAPLSLTDLDAELVRLYARAAESEPRALEVVRGAAAALARATLLVANLLDVQTLVLGGPYWKWISPYFFAVAPDLFVESMAAGRTDPVQLIGSTVGEHLAAVGAASLVLDQTYSPHPGTLVLT